VKGILHDVDQRTKLAGRNRLELLLFRLAGRQRFGINVFKVHEVIQCPPLPQLPGSHTAVRGVATMRGKTITVIDLALAIGQKPQENTEGKFVIITEYNRQVLGFLVSGVDQIINMSWEEILPPPKGVVGASYLTAVARVEDELVEIVDVEKVLQEIMGISEEVSEEIVDLSDREVPHRVLVVDDSTVARNQVRRVLDQIGIESTLCTDGKDALNRLRVWKEEGKVLPEYLSLIISDIEMPQMDGYTLTTEIRKDPEMEELYVVLHSSLSGMFNESMVKTVGADKFLPKYDPDELAKMVQDRLEELRKTQ
jgi:two-component system chemotaxis response regulator CheV